MRLPLTFSEGGIIMELKATFAANVIAIVVMVGFMVDAVII